MDLVKKTAWVGKSLQRQEGKAKVQGKAQYLDDLTLPSLLYGTTVRSRVPRGRIKKITFPPGFPWQDFVVVDADDIPGENIVTLIGKDWPFLAKEFINHPQEPILLLAHPDRYLLEAARHALEESLNAETEVEGWPPVFTLEESLQQNPIIWGKDNIFKTYLLQKGEVEKVWDQAFLVVEETYSTGAQEQLYIEPQGMMALYNEDEGLTIWGSMQCPYYIHKGMGPLFNLPAAKIRIVQTETGGGFGGKEEYPTLLAGHAALLAWKSGRPVKMVYDRSEDMAATTKRHPSRTQHKMAVSKEGKILAMEIKFILDGGAYMTLSPVVLSRGAIHAAGPYRCENVQVEAQVVATNCPPHGAFRGFGAPQSIFAIERHMDKTAAALGLSPLEFRRRNLLQKGDTTATGQIIREEIDWEGLIATAQKHVKKSDDLSRPRGLGMATFMHGAGFTGGGEKLLASVAAAELEAGGKVLIHTSSTEIGQGTNTVFTQIAADALGLPPEMISITRPDTRLVPDSGPTVASRTVMIVGDLVQSACVGLMQTLKNAFPAGANISGENLETWRNASAQYHRQFGTLKSYAQYTPPPQVNWDEEKYRGDAYATYAWAVYLAQVEVDPLTYQTDVSNFIAAQEVGKVVNPIMAQGQIEGGVAQAIGFALYEKVQWKNGQMINNQMTNYIIPTALDLPPIRVFFQENNQFFGPQGAKGIGELPMDGPGPAIINAVVDALGVEINFIPMLPEDLMEKIKEKGERL